jgi:hypothetical protein
MKASATAVLALSLLGSLPAQASTQSYTFDADAQGWLVTDIASTPGVGLAATWDSANQRITTSDIATWTTFSAPPALLGNQSAYYGGSFSFDLQDTLVDANASTVATFGIASGTTALFWFGGAPSTTTLTHFNAVLSETDTLWRFGGLPTDFNSGTAPTAAQFQAVLGSLTSLRINADWKTAGNDQSTLDNVVLQSPVPEPAQALLWVTGVLVLALRRRTAR